MLSVQTRHVPEVPHRRAVDAPRAGEGFCPGDRGPTACWRPPTSSRPCASPPRPRLAVDVDGAFYPAARRCSPPAAPGYCPLARGSFASLPQRAAGQHVLLHPPNRVVELGTQIELLTREPPDPARRQRPRAAMIGVAQRAGGGPDGAQPPRRRAPRAFCRFPPATAVLARPTAGHDATSRPPSGAVEHTLFGELPSWSSPAAHGVVRRPAAPPATPTAVGSDRRVLGVRHPRRGLRIATRSNVSVLATQRVVASGTLVAELAPARAPPMPSSSAPARHRRGDWEATDIAARPAPLTSPTSPGCDAVSRLRTTSCARALRPPPTLAAR